MSSEKASRVGFLPRVMRMRVFGRVFSFAVTAQTARISGAVKDENGAVVVGVTVSLTCENSKKQIGVTTSTGEFSFVENSRKCELEIAHPGFAPVEKTVASGDPIEIVLEIDQSRVTVTAETGRAESRENIPQAVTLIGSDRMNQKSPVVLAQLADEEVGVSFQRTSPTIGAIAVRGLTGKNVSVYIDGVRFTNSAQRGGISTLPLAVTA